jgi:sulfur-carrier protein adenylyltransferase/sulfurtransferase
MDVMRWKQFFTPVKSFSADEAKRYMDRAGAEAYTLLDVRQAGEYESEHIPGAKLIPLPELTDRLIEIDPVKPAIVYCAIGGRSRVAAQVLAAKGFKEVFNLSGGIKAWSTQKAVGPEDLGMDLFSGSESLEETFIAAYSLEEGLRGFYLSMAPRVKSEDARRLFEKLSAIEAKHQDRIVAEFNKLTGAALTRDYFEKQLVAPAMEGGLTTEEYLALYQPNLEVPAEVISLAMAIEAQALDLYQRAAGRCATPESQEALIQIAKEERAHLEQLGKLMAP